MADLINEIESFLDRTRMSPTAFGRASINDGSLVADLKHEGRRLWPETEERIRKFMAERGEVQ